MDNTKKIYMSCDIIREYVPYNTGHIVIDAIALLLLVEKENIALDQISLSILHSSQHNDNGLYRELSSEIINKNIPIPVMDKLFYLLMEYTKEELKKCADILQDNIIFPPNIYNIPSAKWINDLIVKIFKENKGDILLNLDSSSGRFLTIAHDSNIAKKYIGYTFIYEEYITAKAYVYIKEFDESNSYKTRISIYDQNFKDNLFLNKYDMIYTINPFGVRRGLFHDDVNEMYHMLHLSTDDKYFKSHVERYSLSMLGIINGLQILSSNGILGALIPDGGLFNCTDKDIRKYLIEKNYLDTIIFLPGGIIPGTGVNCSLLIAKKNRDSKKHIKMINARELYERKRRHLEFTEENIEQIFEWYKSDTVNENVIFVSKEEIAEQNYNFEFTIYIKRYILENATALGSVTENIFRGYQITAKELDEIVSLDKNETQFYIVNVSDVQPEGYIVSNLQGIRSDVGDKLSKYYLEDGDLIITAKNSIVKTAVYKAEDNKKIILTGNLIAIRLDKNKCDPYYLQAFLNSEDGQNEIKSIQTGTTIKVINPKRLEEMMLPLKVIEDQKEIAALCKKTIQEIQDLKNTLYVKTESLGMIYKR